MVAAMFHIAILPDWTRRELGPVVIWCRSALHVRVPPRSVVAGVRRVCVCRAARCVSRVRFLAPVLLERGWRSSSGGGSRSSTSSRSSWKAARPPTQLEQADCR